MRGNKFGKILNEERQADVIRIVNVAVSAPQQLCGFFPNRQTKLQKVVYLFALIKINHYYNMGVVAFKDLVFCILCSASLADLKQIANNLSHRKIYDIMLRHEQNL